MNTLAEIETAAVQLPPDQQQELWFFLAAQLRRIGRVPATPRDIDLDRIQNWIADDEEGMRRFRESQ